MFGLFNSSETKENIQQKLQETSAKLAELQRQEAIGNAQLNEIADKRTRLAHQWEYIKEQNLLLNEREKSLPNLDNLRLDIADYKNTIKQLRQSLRDIKRVESERQQQTQRAEREQRYAEVRAKRKQVAEVANKLKNGEDLES